MGLVSQITKPLEVPGETGATIDIRMLSWLTLDKAKRIRLGELAEISKMLAGVQGSFPTPAADAQRDRLAEYDKGTLLKHGIVSWSYGETIDIEQLDGPTAEFAARAILDYSLPGEAQSKGGSSPSTGTS